MNPLAGRFLGGDPIGYEGSKWGLYEYCGSNPSKRTDPSGLIWPPSIPCKPCEDKDRRSKPKCCRDVQNANGVDFWLEPVIDPLTGNQFSFTTTFED